LNKKKARKEKKRKAERDPGKKKSLGGKNKRHYTPHKTPSLISISRFLFFFFFFFDGAKKKIS
jgi:hypothetical protein